MITILKISGSALEDKRIYEFAGLSTDSKPTSSIMNGSSFIEINTGKIYFFNEAGSEWIEFKKQEEE